MEVGQYYHLKAYRQTPQGMYLQDEDGEEILLPAKYVPQHLEEGGGIEVFVYLDSQERPTATTQRPKIDMYGFSLLTCVGIAPFGAFMDWGLDRDLLVPNAEMTEGMIVGRQYMTYLFQDEQDRLTGTCLIDQCTQHDEIDLEVGQEVSLLIYDNSKLGVKAIIDQTYAGLIYKDDIYRQLKIGEALKGYIRRIREDKKIDISLRKFGYNKVIDETDKILQLLQVSGGFIALSDKSDPALIQKHLEMSKKVFKKAIGGLYRQKLIDIEDNGIRLKEKE